MLADKKITEAQIIANGVASAPDKLNGTTAQNKSVFDKLVNLAIRSAINPVVDELVSTAGAGNIGTGEIQGLTGTNVQAILLALKAMLDSMGSSQGATNQSVAAQLADRYTVSQADGKLGLKFDTVTAQGLVKSVGYNPATGTFTITSQGGVSTTIDTLLEKVPASFSLEGDKLVLTLEDGTRQSASLAKFIDTYTFRDSGTVAITDVNKAITASVKDNSITMAKMDPAAKNQLEGYATAAEAAKTAAEAASLASQAARDTAQTSAGTATSKATQAQSSATSAEAASTAATASKAASEKSKTEASTSATTSRSYAVGDTGTRPGELTDNAKYYADQAKAIAGKDYVITTVFEAHKYDKENPHGVTASQVGARPNTWTPTAADVGARPSTWTPTAADVGARPDSWVPTAVDVGATPSSHATDAAIHVTAADKTAWGGKAEKPRLITLTIPATGWAAATAPDWQQVTVAVPGLADGSVIDLQPTDVQLNQLSTDGVGIIRADNVAGVCTIKCKDAVPTVAMTVQATITEVRA